MQRQYTIHTQAWWASANPLPFGVTESVGFCFREDNGHLGEGRVTWHDLGRKLAAPRLEVFDDGWMMLDVLAEEGFFIRLRALDGENVAPDAFCELLREFGFEDATQRRSPDEPGRWCPSCGQERP